MTDTDYTDDLVLLANTPAQAKFLLYSLNKQQEALAFIWTQIKELMCVKQDRTITTLSGKCHVIAHEDEEVRMILSPRWTNII